MVVPGMGTIQGFWDNSQVRATWAGVASWRAATVERSSTKGSDGLDGLRAANGPHAGLGETEAADSSCVDELLHGAGDVFDGDVRVDSVLVEEVDRLYP